MATEFIMPKLGLTMEEGTISEWLLPHGAEVTAGDAVLRIETDKTETDVEATGSGVLHHVAEVGQTFACGELIGWYLASGEAPPAATAPTAQAANAPAGQTPAAGAVAAPAPIAASGRQFVSPNARRLATERGIPLHAIAGTGPNGRIVSEDLDQYVPGAAAPAAAVGAGALAAAGWAGSGATLATHAGRQLADLLGIDIATIPPDPQMGRVTRDGVAAHVRSLLGAHTGPAPTVAPAIAPAVASSLMPALQEPSKIIALKGMRGTIAKRMHQSLTDMAQLSLFMDADIDAVIADRETRKGQGAAPSYTDYVLAAAARALREHPGVNAQITDDGVALLPEVHVGLAVALDDGLIVPVIRDTLGHSLSSLAKETSRLAEAARTGSLTMPDLEGGTFSVSTLGMFGVDGFTPVINPPNAAILGVGRIREELVAADDGMVSRVKRMTLSLTWDHRVFDGAPAAAFTKTIVDLLATPDALDMSGDK